MLPGTVGGTGGPSGLTCPSDREQKMSLSCHVDCAAQLQGVGNDMHIYTVYTCIYIIHVLMRDEKDGRKKQGQTNNKAKQHTCSTPKALNFHKKNELLYLGWDSNP